MLLKSTALPPGGLLGRALIAIDRAASDGPLRLNPPLGTAKAATTVTYSAAARSTHTSSLSFRAKTDFSAKAG